MILSELILPNSINRRCQYSGSDHPDQCFDRAHFDCYLHSIEYVYNSRGFRDQEWPTSPEELTNAIWCIGDSFTVGLGSPIKHTWPFLLSQRTKQRIINVSMDGASNGWIARCASLIQQQVQPRNIVIMWSYLHRRETENFYHSSEQRRLHFSRASTKEDIEYFKSAVDKVNNAVHLTIPKFSPYYEIVPEINDTWKQLTGSTDNAPQSQQDLINLNHTAVGSNASGCQQLENLLALKEILEHNQITQVYNLDLARDGHHFDLVTAHWTVDQIITQLK